VALLVPKGKRNRENKLYLSGTAIVRLLDQNPGGTFKPKVCGCFLQNKPNFPHFQPKNKDCQKNKANLDYPTMKTETNPKSSIAGSLL
jgi:hypothetical protein